MNFFRRAIRYCWRQKVRSIILLLVFTLLASAALIALSVGHATAEETDDVKQTVGALFVLKLTLAIPTSMEVVQKMNGVRPINITVTILRRK